LGLFVAGRLAAASIAAALIGWRGIGRADALLLLYGPLSTLAFAASTPARRRPAAWALDFAASLTLVILSGDWRSPFYLVWLGSLALPATLLPPRPAAALAAGAALTYLLVAVIGGPVPGRLQLVSTETLAIHVSLPFLFVCSLAYGADALRRLAAERAERERLAIETERRRIAWELHDSAKQRLHAAHLLVSSLHGHVDDGLAATVQRAEVELESAAAEMDTSLAELRSPLEGRRLDEALRARVAELAMGEPMTIGVHGAAPPLPPLVGTHAYRISCEALTNALRHSGAGVIDVELQARPGGLRISVVDDGVGLPERIRSGASGLHVMRSRAATIGGHLAVGPGRDGRGTCVALDVPLNPNGGSA
jgi:two-component system sensor histidine kinase UhpB